MNILLGIPFPILLLSYLSVSRGGRLSQLATIRQLTSYLCSLPPLRCSYSDSPVRRRITGHSIGLNSNPSTGLVNVLVFMLTRPHILLFGPRRGQITETPRPLMPHSNHSATALGPHGAESFITNWNAKSPGSPWTATSANTKSPLFRTPSSPYINPKARDDTLSISSMTKRMSDGTVGKENSDIVLQDFAISDHGTTLPRIEVQRPAPSNRLSKTSLRSDPLPVKAMPEADLEAFRPYTRSDDDHNHFPYERDSTDIVSPAISDGLGSSWVTMPAIKRAVTSNRNSVDTLTITDSGDLVGSKMTLPVDPQQQHSRFNSSRYAI